MGALTNDGRGPTTLRLIAKRMHSRPTICLQKHRRTTVFARHKMPFSYRVL
jgi:hypothetical protein